MSDNVGAGKTLFKLVVSVILFLGIVGMMGAFLLVRRGFRASSTPTAAEATVARAMRNLSIPKRERRARNPLETSSDALQQGREYFLTRCAVCHGIDGSGQTQIGLNLYPRASDLRASKTQSLTDGELHYIIENGIQLTGMPAWGNPHRESTENSWQLVLFIRSLRPLTHPESLHQSNTAGSASYVGSPACEKCHEQIYQRWKKTPMANVVRDPRAYPDAIIPNLATNTLAKFSAGQIAFVYGSIWKQRYFTRIGDDYFPMPAQWDIATHQWLRYVVPAKGADWWGAYYPPDNMHRPTGPTCDGCHSVDYDIHAKKPVEWNVGCERCHGPGSEHAAHPVRGNIFNPAHMDAVAENEVCIQCHSQGRPVNNPVEGKYYDWPVGYHVGLRLQDYWKLEDCSLGQTGFYYFPDCTAHKNRMQGNDFVQSVMYRRGITCSSCHDVHGTANYAQLRQPENKICLDCHGPSSPNGPHTATLEEHTHHKEGSSGSQCVGCHMPKIETEGVPGALVHAHTFRFIAPAMTDKYSIPNSCTSCHADKSTAWAANAIRHWPQPNPWQRLGWTSGIVSAR
jgi:predicted CXXCH cytochrome family protein